MKLFDTTPIIAFLGNLDNKTILTHLINSGYSLYVPNAVADEVIYEPAKSNMEFMIKMNQIHRLSTIPEQELQTFRNRYFKVGKGESEVFIWALQWQKENKKFCCILDDGVVRKIAERLNLKYSGTIGILQKLNEKGLISSEELAGYLKRLKECHFRYIYLNRQVA